ncbi:MAG: haloacid dehalogenase [Candidatus Desulfacyla sp.]
MRTEERKIRPAELAFDIDGVIADTFRAFVKAARDSYGLEIEYEAITDYDFRKVIDIDDETSDAIIEQILEDPLGLGIAPVQGAVDVLRRLSCFGPLCFVTARTNRDAIMAWVRHTLQIENGGSIQLEATGTHENKLPVLLKHGIRYFVEDRLETCYLIQQSPVTPIVFDQPWNRQAHPFLSVGSWDEIRDMVEWEAT